MRKSIQGVLWVIVVLLLAVWAILPHSVLPPGLRIGKISLGKDLAGGVSLVYQVAIKPGDPPDTLARVIEVLKRRVDPQGTLEISMVAQGADRIEITMPLPTAQVKSLRLEYERLLKDATAGFVSGDDLQRVFNASTADRDLIIASLAGSNADLAGLIRDAAAKYDAAQAARRGFEEPRQRVKELTEQVKALELVPPAERNTALIESTKLALQAAQSLLDERAAAAAPAELAFEAARDKAANASVSERELRAAMARSKQSNRIKGTDGKIVEIKSPRAQAVERLKEAHPAASAMIDRVLSAWEHYESERQTLDDPEDLKRLLAGAGVLNFRITVKPGQLSDEATLRQQVAERGPRGAGNDQVGWYKLNKLESWYDSVAELEAMQAAPQAYFMQRRSAVVEPYQGEYYMLCYRTPGSQLTEAEGAWRVAGATQGVDQLGAPAINFSMDVLGANKLGKLTENNVGNFMAVLLDDEVYTAPTLRDRIASNGQISGRFTQREINYIVQVLAAGSLQAKLSREPISQTVVGPTLGADNLRAGLVTGAVAFVLVAGFMVVYYFGSGAIAVVALTYNFVLVMGIMALNQAAFTVPGIAGVVLTFGQAVDSNVLIYERMREEMLRGADLKTAVRLGFTRALSPIVDGNISNLIICAVLGYFGTPEIRGFAVTLGVGVLTTLFTSLVVSRLMFNILIDRFGWRKTSQLPMAVPAVQRMLSPHVDWMKHRHTLLGALVVFLVVMTGVTAYEGKRLLGTEFVGGTQIELHFKNDEAGRAVMLSRSQVQERLAALAKTIENPAEARLYAEAEIVPVTPQSDGVTSGTFRLRFPHANEQALLAGITREFGDVLDIQGALRFKGSGAAELREAPVYPILTRDLGTVIDRPSLVSDVREYNGGVAVVIEDIQPASSKESLQTRLDDTRRRPEYSTALMRAGELRVLDGTDKEVKTAVLLVRDETVPAYGDMERWEREVASQEWKLVNDALSRASQPASVQSFSPAIARTFMAQGIVSTALSMLMLTIYVFARFGAFRWAIAATVPLFADAVGIVGLLAVADWLCEFPATSGIARSLGLMPFKVDLAQIAAILTIIGYSLNDKIIILDRIRENKGKLPYASYQVINDSINQTMTRTVITAGAHMITTIVLYLYGGEAVRGFAYTFNLGVLLGTYTSIVSTPLVWSHAEDLTRRSVGGSAGGATNNGATSAAAAGAAGGHA